MPVLPDGFLRRPRVQVVKSDEGVIEGVIVRFRVPSIKATRTLEPYQHVLLDLSVDEEDRPVTLVLQEPISGNELVKTVKGILQLAGMWRGRPRAEAQELVSLVLRGLFLGLERKIPVPRPRSITATVPA